MNSTKQTIDGVLVSRSLAQALACLEPRGHFPNGNPVDELRALLDKEVSGDSRAPLPQGEPVALPKVLPLDDPRCPRHHLIADGFRSGADWMRREVEKLGPLYAEQPAPVAVVPARVFGINLVVDGNMPDDEMHLVSGEGGTVKLVVNDGKARDV